MEPNQMNNMDFGNTPTEPAKKSHALNIIIGILILALIAVIIFAKKNDNNDNEATPSDTASTTDSGVNSSSTTDGGVSVPEPVGAWTSSSIKNEITFDVPPSYYVSYPVIGECKDVVSITTQTASAPAVPVALIYKAGCITDQVVLTKYTRQEIKNGYVFQTNSTNAKVLELFARIVASAE